jgi:hypothetical protein
MNMLQIVTTVLPAAAIVVTAFFAIRGLHTWRGQLLTKSRFEIAEAIMVATYRIQGRLEHIRNPVAFEGGDKSPRPRPEGIEVAAARKDMYFVPFARLQQINDDFAQLSKARLLARVHFGPTSVAPFDAISGVYREIAAASRMLVDTAEESRQNRLELVQKWEATIWDISGGTDALAQRMQAAVSEIESLCRPALTFNTPQPRSWRQLFRREAMERLRARRVQL